MASTSPIELKRHYRELSPKEVDELVAVVADLIVEFIKQKGVPAPSPQVTQEFTQEE